MLIKQDGYWQLLTEHLGPDALRGSEAQTPQPVVQAPDSPMIQRTGLNRFLTSTTIERLGPVDQLEDRHFGMVEVVGSNPTRSIDNPSRLSVPVDDMRFER